jgi:hypothetical protein
MPLLRLLAAIFVLATAGTVLATDEKLPAPAFKASLVCFNGEDGSGSSCRSTMAKIEGGLKVVTAKLTCGSKGAVSEITWTYRGQEDGKDLYHIVRKFPSGSNDAKTTEADVTFDGKRQVVFKDQAQCIAIELQPAEK